MVTTEALNAMINEYWPDSPFRCEEVGENYVVAARDVSPINIRPGGYISGPTLFGVADGALWFLAALVRGQPEPMALTSDLSIRFLAPAQGQRVYARAELNKGSRRTMVGSVSVWTDDNEEAPCAIAQGAYVLPAK